MEEFLCPHCGARNPEAAIFCNRCGVEMRQRTAPDQSNEELPPDLHKIDEAAPEVWHDATQATENLESTNYWGQTPDLPAPSLPPVLFPNEQILTPGQSFLEPVTISGELASDLAPVVSDAFADALDVDRARRVRIMLQSEPDYAPASPLPVWRPPSLRSPWIILLLAAAIVLPLALGWIRPTGQAQEWPGVASAYDALTASPATAPVLVYWVYDPTTAGELDLVALPVVSQLLERGQQSLIVTTLPTGLATARRLYARAAEGLPARAGVRRSLWLGDGVYLSGGAMALPLVGQDLPRTLGLASSTGAPALALVVAAQADDVQQWIELAQPRDRLPVIAVTGAGADPILRPYLDSDQLVGLVSGFDGAVTYQSLRQTPLAAADALALQRQVVAQNWGQFALLAVILLGNIAALLGRGRRG